MRYELNLSSGIEGSMLLKMIFVLLLVLSFIHSPAFAQLGPKDGR